MAFPTSPANDQTYTTSLGTTYRYDSTDTAWKIVGCDAEPGVQGATGIQGIQGVTGLVGQTGIQGPGTVSGTDSYLAKFTAATTLGNSMVQQVSNGIAVNGPVGGGENYVSLGDSGYEKIWLTKQGGTHHFVLGLSALSGNAFLVDQTTGDTTFYGSIAENIPVAGVGNAMSLTLDTTRYGRFNPLYNVVDFHEGGLNIEGRSWDGGCVSNTEAIRINGILKEADPADTRPAVLLRAEKNDGGTALAAAETCLALDNLTTRVFHVLGNGDASCNDMRSAHTSNDGYAGVSFPGGSGQMTGTTMGTYDSALVDCTFSVADGGTAIMQIKNGLISYFRYDVAP